MTAATQTSQVHLWELRGVGRGPFRCVGLISMPSAEAFGMNVEGYNNAMRDACAEARAFGVALGSCSVCGTGIHNHYVVRDAAGKHFVCGCDCIEKSGDAGLTTQAKETAKRKAWAKRRAEWQARTIAEHAAQRERNGGLTDLELAEQRQREINAKRAKFAAQNDWLISVLDGMSGDFVASMVEKLASVPACEFSDRQLRVMCDIYCKTHGRRNSKAYRAAEDEFDLRIGSQQAAMVAAGWNF